MKIHVTKEIKDPTADNWGLSAKMGRVRAALSLNAAFLKAVNAGMSESDVYHAVVKEMHAQSEFAAASPEGYRRLGCLLREAFGPQAYL